MNKLRVILWVILAVMTAMPVVAAGEAVMKKALPVWASGREKEMNLTLGFRAVFKAEKGQEATLRIAASTIYRVYINGEFVGAGPARAAEGFFRMDEYEVSRFVTAGDNYLSVEVNGYNINTYCAIDQPSFLQAEVEAGGAIVLATGKNKDFEAFAITERVQKTERYSFQRAFTEYYRLKPGYDQWRTAKTAVAAVKLKVFPAVRLQPRGVLMPGFARLAPVAVYSKGTFTIQKPAKYYRDRSLVNISPTFKGFPEAELYAEPSQRIQEMVTVGQSIINKPPVAVGAVGMKSGEFYTFDFGGDRSGFIGARLHVNSRTTLYLHFDELLTNGDVTQKKRQSDINNQLVYELEAGDYAVESIEPYTVHFLKAMVVEGDARLDDLYIREYAYPANPNSTFAANNYKLNVIYEAAKQTSRQNSVDVFTDCPSRERAGWLCDSYFATVTEKELTGYSRVAHNFLENYAVADSFPYLPAGMIPMCYPADHPDHNFIPQWSLWFILQTDVFEQNGGDPLLVARLKPRIEKLLGWFARYENSDGLLEKMPAWNFVEWSAANGFVHDVNYPTNMLYSAALKRAARLYGNQAWEQKAERIKQTVIKQSFNGEFFVDNAMRENGKLRVTDNTTEACQYYAFFFDVATPSTHPELWRRLVNEFGPNRDDKKVWPKVFRANAFVGNYLRMDILSRYGLQSQMLLEIQDYFYAMADQTGTLWEHMSHGASCNHGFAAYIAHVLYRDVLGASHIDYINKTVTLRFADLVLDRCEGSIPVGDEKITLKWQRKGNAITYSVSVPSGYQVKIDNRSSATLNRQ